MKPLLIRGTLVSCSLLFIGCRTSSGQIIDHDNRFNARSARTFSPFVRDQLRHTRVRKARETVETSLEKMFRERDISYPATEVYVRVFKRERELELWVRPQDGNKFKLLRTYPVCALAGVLGPKQSEGDRQVPEGFYSINLFNPESSYHLSLRIDYPNKRDRAAQTRRDLGGDIFIHGGCKSDGCLAVTDTAINEIYWVAVMARGMGQQSIPVHIFPARLNNLNTLVRLIRVYHDEPSVLAFWQTLKPGYDYFEKNRQLPAIDVDTQGRYRIAQGAASAL